METKETQRMILHLGTDLMMASSIGTLARQRQIGFRSFTTAGKLVEAIGANVNPLVIINMQLPGLDIAELGKQLIKLGPNSITVLWFAQHVYEDLLHASAVTGIGVVLTRGQLSKKLPELVSQWEIPVV